MKLLLQTVFMENKLLQTNLSEHEVGESRTDRTRCPKCLSMFTMHSQFIDKRNGYGTWVVTSKLHCA